MKMDAMPLIFLSHELIGDIYSNLSEFQCAATIQIIHADRMQK